MWRSVRCQTEPDLSKDYDSLNFKQRLISPRREVSWWLVVSPQRLPAHDGNKNGHRQAPILHGGPWWGFPIKSGGYILLLQIRSHFVTDTLNENGEFESRRFGKEYQIVDAHQYWSTEEKNWLTSALVLCTSKFWTFCSYCSNKFYMFLSFLFQVHTKPKLNWINPLWCFESRVWRTPP